MSTQETTSPGELEAVVDEAPPARRHEVLGIVAAAATVLTALCLVSYDQRTAENLIGPVGRGVAAFLVSAFGLAAWAVPLELGATTVGLFRLRQSALGIAQVASTFIVLFVGCALAHLALRGHEVFGGHLAGGAIGEVLGEVLRSLLGLAGAYVVAIATLLVTLVLRTPLSVIAVVRGAARGLRASAGASWHALVALRDAWREARDVERAERAARAALEEPRIVTTPGIVTAPIGGEAPALDRGRSASGDSNDISDEALRAAEASAGAADDAEPGGPLGLDGADGAGDLEDSDAGGLDGAGAEAAPFEPVPPAAKLRRGKGPRIVAPIQPTKSRRRSPLPVTSAGGTFLLPASSVFDEAPPSQIRVDEARLREKAAHLVEKLNAYDVQGRVDEILPGPVVTMFEFEPATGIKIAKIANLANDVAMALAAQKVRIVAPIPGKARVGFELPNDDRQMVYLRELLEAEPWQTLHAALPVALGKDIAGRAVYGDLSKMPHLLVAGTTGSGKSVGINVMLASLLTRKTPDDVRLIMIDPKKVELEPYDGIPHMLLPVVTDMKKAALALRWAVDEMERRYQVFADTGVKSITSYNERVDRMRVGEIPKERFFARQKPRPPEDPSEPTPEPERLSYVVIVVDEFAELMQVAAKDVEASIARLAQKARAAGIHLIVATQRPSVDVITGYIRSNFPCRIAYRVMQQADSKTILATGGAEHLLGKGDMLMIAPDSSELKRVHSAYVSEAEIQRLCDFLRAQGAPVYDEEILRPRDEDDEGPGYGGPASDDPLYDKAVQIVANAGYCSISHIQRVLEIGYNKAAKLVERMEAEGVVGPQSSKAGGRREVLVRPQ